MPVSCSAGEQGRAPTSATRSARSPARTRGCGSASSVRSTARCRRARTTRATPPSSAHRCQRSSCRAFVRQIVVKFRGPPRRWCLRTASASKLWAAVDRKQCRQGVQGGAGVEETGTHRNLSRVHGRERHGAGRELRSSPTRKKALGDPKSITYSGSAKDVAFQQCGANATQMNCQGPHNPMRPIANYVRVIDLAAPASRHTGATNNIGAGGSTTHGSGHVLRAGDAAAGGPVAALGRTAIELYITPWGFLKGAGREQRHREARTASSPC